MNKFSKEDVCPFCESKKREILDTEQQDGVVEYKCQCTNCGELYNQFYTEVFSGQTIVSGDIVTDIPAKSIAEKVVDENDIELTEEYLDDFVKNEDKNSCPKCGSLFIVHLDLSYEDDCYYEKVLCDTCFLRYVKVYKLSHIAVDE